MEEKKDEPIRCIACGRVKNRSNPGLLCPQGHFLCSLPTSKPKNLKENNKNTVQTNNTTKNESCASTFSRTVLTDDEMLLCDVSNGSFKVKCADCKVHIDLSKFENFIPPDLLSNFQTNIAIYTMDKGDIWLSCPLCSTGAVYSEHTDIILYCHNPKCQKMTCRLCQKNVDRNREQHLTVCWENFDFYQKLNTKIEEAQKAVCPHCGLSGMKNTACCEITCSSCGKWWCYACACPPEECERHINDVNTSHLLGQYWKTNLKRCPHYLQQYHEVDPSFPEDPNEALSFFHRHIYLARMKLLLLEFGKERVRKLLELKPRLLENDKIDDILSSKFPAYLKRGKYAKYN